MQKDIQKYNIEEIITSIEIKKNAMIKNCREMERLFKENKEMSRSINGFDPLQFKYCQYKHGDGYEKYINRICWYYIVSVFDMRKYMLCSEYDRMMEGIENNKTPDFTRKNVLGWVAGLKQLIHDNLNTLVKQVFSKITKEGYRTGPGGWRAAKKKRNNNGVDSFFIISTSDYYYVFNYRSGITITDDLEKCLYILAGRKLPEKTVKKMMRENKKNEWENDIWRVKACKNGNTHYWIKDEKVLMLLNKIGSGNGTIGENIRIKILERG